MGDLCRQRTSGQERCSDASTSKLIPLAEVGKGEGREESDNSDTSDTRGMGKMQMTRGRRRWTGHIICHNIGRSWSMANVTGKLGKYPQDSGGG